MHQTLTINKRARSARIAARPRPRGALLEPALPLGALVRRALPLGAVLALLLLASCSAGLTAGPGFAVLTMTNPSTTNTLENVMIDSAISVGNILPGGQAQEVVSLGQHTITFDIYDVNGNQLAHDVPYSVNVTTNPQSVSI